MNYLLFTDLANSTKQATADPAKASADRKSMIQATLNECKAHQGQVTQYTGDGFLCIAPTLKAAVTIGENIIRKMVAIGLEIRVAINCSDDLPAKITLISPEKVTADEINAGHTSEIFHFDDEAYLDVAKAARLLGITRVNQILVADRAYTANGAGAATAPANKWYGGHPLMVLKDYGEPEQAFEYLYNGESKGRPLSPYLPDYYTRRGNLYVRRPKLEEQIRHGLFDAMRPDSTAPILVIKGDGGTGKSRLAEESVISIAGLFRTVVWIGVAGDIMSPAEAEKLCEENYELSREFLLPQYAEDLSRVMAERLGMLASVYAYDEVKNKGNKSRETFIKSFLECLREYHRANPKGIVVIDNWEPLNFRAGDDKVAKACCLWLDDVQRIANTWAFLVTSRDTPSLYPPPRMVGIDEGLEESEAAELLRNRFEREQSPEALKGLAKACDYIPLALELASARAVEYGHAAAEVAEEIKRLTVIELRTGLVLADDEAGRFRHAAIKASLEFSYNLLSEEEKRVYRCCSVFVAPWSKEAGNAILGDDGHGQTALVRASRLRSEDRIVCDTEKSFFSLHPAARLFAAGKLASDSQEREEAQVGLMKWSQATVGEPQADSFCRLEAEEENWLEGLRLVARADADTVCKLLFSLQIYTFSAKRLRGLSAWLVDDAISDAVLADVQLLLGERHYYEGRNQEAIASWQKAEQFYIASDDPLGRGNVASSIGDLHYFEGRNQEALAAWQKADEFYVAANSYGGRGNVARSTGTLHFREGRNNEALAAWQMADELYVLSGHPQGRGNVAQYIANLHFREGRNEEALVAWQKADEFFVASGDPQGRGNVAKSIGNLHFHMERRREALAAWQKADEFFVASGDPQGRGNVAKSIGDLDFAEGRNQDALAAWQKADEFYSSSGNPVGKGSVALSRARYYYAANDLGSAGRFLELARRFYESCHFVQGLESVMQLEQDWSLPDED